MVQHLIRMYSCSFPTNTKNTLDSLVLDNRVLAR